MPRLRTRIGAGCILYNESGDEQESVNRGCRDMSGVIGQPLEGAVMGDDGDCRRRITEAAVALPYAVYLGVQMLEIHAQNGHFRHFWGPPARLVGGNAHSATRCSITRSDMTRARPRHPETECVEVHRNCHINVR